MLVENMEMMVIILIAQQNAVSNSAKLFSMTNSQNSSINTYSITQN